MSFQNVCEVLNICQNVTPLTLNIEAKISAQALGSSYSPIRYYSLHDYHVNVLRPANTVIEFSLNICNNTEELKFHTHSMFFKCMYRAFNQQKHNYN